MGASVWMRMWAKLAQETQALARRVDGLDERLWARTSGLGSRWFQRGPRSPVQITGSLHGIASIDSADNQDPNMSSASCASGRRLPSSGSGNWSSKPCPRNQCHLVSPTCSTQVNSILAAFLLILLVTQVESYSSSRKDAPLSVLSMHLAIEVQAMEQQNRLAAAAVEEFRM